MTFLSELHEAVAALGACGSLDVAPEKLLHAMRDLGDEGFAAAMANAATVARLMERLAASGAAVMAERPALVQAGGHRNPVALVQHITGGTKADAVRTVRAGESLVGATDGVTDAGGPAGDGGAGVDGPGVDGPGVDGGLDLGLDAGSPVPVRPWHACLGEALMRGRLSTAQVDAIRSGLGEPPTRQGESCAEVWALGAEQLIDIAAEITVEQLGGEARAVRDMLDVVGAQERAERNFAARSFRMWVDADGVSHAHIRFDDEAAAWVGAVRDAALRPRRGGPRFMTDEERAAADELSTDPRTNAQLEYDLFVDLLQAGGLANPADVFGSRQPGVRMVVMKDAVGPRDLHGRLLAVGHLEDGGQPVAATPPIPPSARAST